MIFPDIAKVLQIMGGLCSTTMCYLIPTYCWVKVNPAKGVTFGKVAPIIFFCTLAFMGYCSVIVTIKDIIEGEK